VAVLLAVLLDVSHQRFCIGDFRSHRPSSSAFQNGQLREFRLFLEPVCGQPLQFSDWIAKKRLRCNPTWSRRLFRFMRVPNAQPYYFLLSCWGEEFREHLCRLALPSLLAPGNISALTRKSAARFLIATTAEDRVKLKKEPIFAALAKEITVEFLANEAPQPPVHKYIRMSRGHAMLADRCFHDKAIAININPDSIYPDGSVAEAQRLAVAGADVVLCAAVRFEMEGVEAELAARGLLRRGSILRLPVREAVEIGLRNLHAETRASNWMAANFGALAIEHEDKFFLTCCYWEVPGYDGMLIITHNWAPFLVNYAALGTHDKNALDGRNLDGPYIFENFPKYTDAIHVVTDSDSLFLLGLTPRDEMRPEPRLFPWRGPGVLGEWARGYVLSRTVFDPRIDSYRRKIYRTPIRWHSHDYNEHWRPVEGEVDRLIREYVYADARILPQHPTRNEIWRWFWYRWVLTRTSGVKSLVLAAYYNIGGKVRFRTRLRQLIRWIQVTAGNHIVS
jgi:hypothetical protein